MLNGGHHGRRSIMMSKTTTTTTATWLEDNFEEDIKTTDSDKNSIIHLKSKNNVMSLIEAPLSGTIFLHCPVHPRRRFSGKINATLLFYYSQLFPSS